MSEVDKAIFEEVVKNHPGIQAGFLEVMLLRINRWYAERKKKESKIDFIKLRNRALEECGSWDLFEHRAYKDAIIDYYHQRRQKLRQGPSLEVVEATDLLAVINVDNRVEVTFEARRATGKLVFADIDTGRKRRPLSSRSTNLHEALYLKAKRKALAIMNSRRK